MAVGDIFKADFHFENPSGKASAGIYFRETTANASELDVCGDIAEGLETKLRDELLAILSSDWWFTAIQVQKNYPTATVNAIDPPNTARQVATAPGIIRTMADQQGNFNGGANEPALPANNAIQFDLVQSALGLRRNGRFNVPGIPESQTNGGTLISAYVTSCNVFAALLATVVNSPGDIGVWEPVIISATIRDALGVGNPKDWVSSVLPIDDIVCNPIISVQRRRATRVKGGIR